MPAELRPPRDATNNEMLQILARKTGTAQTVEVDSNGVLIALSEAGAIVTLYALAGDVFAGFGDAGLVAADAVHFYEGNVRHTEAAPRHATHIFVKAKSSTTTLYLSELT